MITLRLTLLAAACAATAALAQTAGAPGTAAPAAPASTATQPGAAAPGTVNPSLGSVPGSTISGTNPSLGSVPGSTVIGASPPLGSVGPAAASPSLGTGGIANSNTSVAAQAAQRRQLALQQCQALSGAAQNDCIRTADDDFSRSTGTETLAQQGQGSIVAGTQGPATGPAAAVPDARSQPSVSPTSRDNNSR
jgi:hypothetical protein